MVAASAVELQPVASVTDRLHGLLAHARDLKQSYTIEPALPSSELAAGVDTLQDDIDGSYDQVFRTNTVETAARQIFYDLVTSTSIDSPNFVEVWNLLDILLLAGDRGKCDGALVIYCIEELLDSQTTDGCRKVFDYLESRRERLAQKDFHKKNLVFLRSCNELLRRLSRAEDAIFCGRVFFFLFQTFPLGDKSSVNLRGDFHVDNVTTIDLPEESKTKDGEEMVVDSEMPVSAEATSKEQTPAPKEATPLLAGKPESKLASFKAARDARKPVEEPLLENSTLYPIFWGLQKAFSNPRQMMKDKGFPDFKAALQATIAKFKKTPPVVSMRATKEQNGDGTGNAIDNYNPKYLTSRDLFDLELSDLAFQRHILVQALILLDFLMSVQDKAKAKLATLPSTNRSLVYDEIILSDDDQKWTVQMRSMITKYLQECDKDGRFYCRMVETVLARDKNWVRWKLESCPSIVQDPVSAATEMDARRSAKDATKPRRVPEKPMGAMDLSFLDEGVGVGLEALEDRSQFSKPTINQLVEAIKTDQLDQEMAMDDAENEAYAAAIANKKWRAVRMASSKKLALLSKLEPNGDLDPLLGIKSENGQDHHVNGTDGAQDENEGIMNGDGPAVNVTNADREAEGKDEGEASDSAENETPGAMEVEKTEIVQDEIKEEGA
ncbi:hypothetical protein K431DRAFT_217797 [Polychaeton citri CBS 116435]|uniref:Nuclear matrix protein n=1 Tax=Polychaeton citri CBS 116435 TaxID=1314669 RepID=A0A9P4UQG0_9PEZI|nr:hypothetical protein K431DRAFT_217797 [Polychaeton citri CBS 116435]